MKWIPFGEGPDRQRNSASGLEHPQHLPNTIERRREKHHTEAADDSIEGMIREGQTVCEGHFKPNVVQLSTLRLATTGPDHFPNGIDSNNRAFRADCVGNA